MIGTILGTILACLAIYLALGIVFILLASAFDPEDMKKELNATGGMSFLVAVVGLWPLFLGLVTAEVIKRGCLAVAEARIQRRARLFKVKV